MFHTMFQPRAHENSLEQANLGKRKSQVRKEAHALQASPGDRCYGVGEVKDRRGGWLEREKMG